MTVVVGSASPDGLVLSSDSRTLERAGDRARVSSDATEKVYLAGTYGIATYGVGSIATKTIRGLMDEYTPPDGGNVENCANELGAFFQQRLQDATPVPRSGGLKFDPRWPLGFLVAGYDDQGIGKVVNVRIRPGDVQAEATEITTANPGVIYFGDATDAIDRLILGFDRRRLSKVGLGDDDVVKKLEKLRYDWIHPHTVADAIDLSRFLVGTAISMRRFSDGTLADTDGSLPSAGGPIQTLAITRTGYRWVETVGIDQQSF